MEIINRLALPGHLLLGFILSLLLFPAVSEARSGSGEEPVIIAWEPNSEPDVAGYKFHYGTQTGSYSQSLDVGILPEAVLTNLVVGTTYYCAVTAYNVAGLESAFSEELSITYIPLPSSGDTSGRLILMEAEEGVFAGTMTVTHGTLESWIDASSYTNATSASSTISFDSPTAASYVAWCRVKAPTESSDSFRYTMDGAPESIFHVYGTPTPPAGTRSPDWIWRKILTSTGDPATFDLTEGAHSLKFLVREFGAKLDRIVLSTDTLFQPDDSLPKTGDALVIVSPPEDKTLSPGQAATFTVKAVTTGTSVSYQWAKNGAQITGANSPTLTIPAIQSGDIGTYSVQLFSGSAEPEQAFATLAVVPLSITGMTVGANLQMSFSTNRPPESNVQVYASDNLTDWTLLPTPAVSNGVVNVTDAAALGKKRRFYRLATP